MNRKPMKTNRRVQGGSITSTHAFLTTDFKNKVRTLSDKGLAISKIAATLKVPTYRVLVARGALGIHGRNATVTKKVTRKAA